MASFRNLSAVGLIMIAGVAFAHTDVANPAVKARMGAMMAISAEVKTLSKMSRGEVDFDAATAAAAFERIAAEAARVPELFEAPEMDPKSEAAAEIWESWEDFTAKSEAMKAAAESSAGIDSPAALGSAVGNLGATCKACHALYKI